MNLFDAGCGGSALQHGEGGILLQQSIFNVDSETFPGIVFLMCVSGFACPAVLSHKAVEKGDGFSAIPRKSLEQG